MTRKMEFGKLGTIPIFSFYSALEHHHQLLCCQLGLLDFETWDGRFSTNTATPKAALIIEFIDAALTWTSWKGTAYMSLP